MKFPYTALTATSTDPVTATTTSESTLEAVKKALEAYDAAHAKAIADSESCKEKNAAIAKAQADAKACDSRGANTDNEF